MAGGIRHFLQFCDFDRTELEYVFERTRIIKERFKRYESYQPLHDRTLAMVFEKHSTRTRVSFEAGMHQLGGSVITLMTRDTQLGRGEPIEDVARVITRMVDIVMIRTFEQANIERFAAHSRVPVDQRAHQRVSPVPDPGRHLHVHRAPRADHRAARSRGSATRTTCATRGCRRPSSSISTPRVDAAGLRARARASRACAGRASTRSSTIRWKRCAAPTSSRPTSGPAWASKPRTTSASGISRTGRSTPR